MSVIQRSIIIPKGGQLTRSRKYAEQNYNLPHIHNHIFFQIKSEVSQHLVCLFIHKTQNLAHVKFILCIVLILYVLSEVLLLPSKIHKMKIQTNSYLIIEFISIFYTVLYSALLSHLLYRFAFLLTETFPLDIFRCVLKVCEVISLGIFVCLLFWKSCPRDSEV